jgi:hypothetical protein
MNACPSPIPTEHDQRGEDPLGLVVERDRCGRGAAEDGDLRVAQLLRQADGSVRNQGNCYGGQSGREAFQPVCRVDQKLRRQSDKEERMS